MESLLSLILFSPLVMAGVMICISTAQKQMMHRLGRISAWFSLGLSFLLLICALGQDGWFLIQDKPWVGSLKIAYALGADGLTSVLCLFNAIIMLIAVHLARKTIQKREKAFHILVCILQTGIYGVFLATDIFLFYIFWEVALIPLYFLIGIWGGVRREYAAIKFFIYTIVGSIFMLLAVVALLYLNPLSVGLDFTQIKAHQSWIAQTQWAGYPLDKILFLAFFFAFAVKIPVFPFHTWLPDAHVQAPTAISVILAGVLLKLGVYGLIRFGFGFFPEALFWFAPVLLILGLINLLYGGLNAMYQKDLKAMIAYSSISHMGFCILGVASMTVMGVEGAVLQMVSHGFIAAMLFIVAGLIYERTYSLEIGDLGGLSTQMPGLNFFAVFVVFACIGLPGLSGFAAEWWVLTGSFLHQTSFDLSSIWMLAIALLAIFITAVYMLWSYQRVFLGPLGNKWSSLEDLMFSEWIWLFVLMILIVVLGIWPTWVTQMVSPMIQSMVVGL